MKANLLDNGIGDTLVSPAFDDVTLISHGRAQIMDAEDPKLLVLGGKHDLRRTKQRSLPSKATLP